MTVKGLTVIMAPVLMVWADTIVTVRLGTLALTVRSRSTSVLATPVSLEGPALISIMATSVGVPLEHQVGLYWFSLQIGYHCFKNILFY